MKLCGEEGRGATWDFLDPLRDAHRTRVFKNYNEREHISN